MRIPLEISYRNVEKTTQIEKLIHEKVERLEKICDTVMSCRVAVEKTQKHMQSGNPYRVRIEVTVPPGHTIISKREPGEGDMHHDIPAVLRDTFKAAERQLKDNSEKQHGDVKKHPIQETQAVVDKLFHDRGYGFLKTTDDHEIYFHKNSVLHEDFNRLEIGTGVRFIEEEGDKGPQATSVQVVDKPGTRIQ
ncbi:MAG: HPF/RaiA family ribosome-associated protein [Calditrichaceae bacterium]